MEIIYIYLGFKIRKSFFSKPEFGEKPFKLLLYLFIRCEFWKFNHWAVCSYYILHSCKISSKRPNINSYAINQIFKFQVFVVLLGITNNFIDWIVNNIRFKWNLTCMLWTKKNAIQWLDFKNSHQTRKYMRNLKDFSLN